MILEKTKTSFDSIRSLKILDLNDSRLNLEQQRKVKPRATSMNIGEVKWCVYLTKSEPFLNGTDGALRAPN